jgi:hypothetical protein
MEHAAALILTYWVRIRDDADCCDWLVVFRGLSAAESEKHWLRSNPGKRVWFHELKVLGCLSIFTLDHSQVHDGFNGALFAWELGGPQYSPFWLEWVQHERPLVTWRCQARLGHNKAGESRHCGVWECPAQAIRLPRK